MKELNKTIQDLKVKVETIKKSKSETSLEHAFQKKKKKTKGDQRDTNWKGRSQSIIFG